MTKALLFPYHPDIDIIAKHKNMLNGYEIVGVISYKDDDKVVDNLHAQLGIERLAYELILEKCDEIIVLENYRNFNDEKYYQVIEDALAKDIRIVITPSAEKQLDLCKYVGQYETLKNSYDFLDYFETDHQVRVDLNAESIIVCPIIVNSDCIGSIVCVSSNKEFSPSDAKCVSALNCLLCKNCEL